MVVTDLPAISDTCTWHENARLPSTWIVQAPHSPVPQPNFVPVSLSCSRITHSSGVAGGASLDAGRPFTTKFVAIVFPPCARGGAGPPLGACLILVLELSRNKAGKQGRPRQAPDTGRDRVACVALGGAVDWYKEASGSVNPEAAVLPKRSLGMILVHRSRTLVPMLASRAAWSSWFSSQSGR